MRQPIRSLLPQAEQQKRCLTLRLEVRVSFAPVQSFRSIPDKLLHIVTPERRAARVQRLRNATAPFLCKLDVVSRGQDAVRRVVGEIPAWQEDRDIGGLGRAGRRKEQQHLVVGGEEGFDLIDDKQMVRSRLEALVTRPGR